MKQFEQILTNSLVGLSLIIILNSCGLNKSIVKASANLKKGMSELDITGVKKLLDENKSLEQDLLAIKAKLDESYGAGAIELNERNLVIKVNSFTGSWNVSAWINTKDNLAWRRTNVSNMNRELLMEDISTFKNNFVEEMKVNPKTVKIKGSIITMDFNSLKTYLNIVHKERLDIPSIFSSEKVPMISLQEQLGKSVGTHVVGINLVPLVLDSTGDCRIRIHLELIRANGQIEILKVYEYNVKIDNLPLGQAIPEDRMVFYTSKQVSK